MHRCHGPYMRRCCPTRCWWRPHSLCFPVTKRLYSTAVIVVVQTITPEQATVFNCYARCNLIVAHKRFSGFITIAFGVFSHSNADRTLQWRSIRLFLIYKQTWRKGFLKSCKWNFSTFLTNHFIAKKLKCKILFFCLSNHPLRKCVEIRSFSSRYCICNTELQL